MSSVEHAPAEKGFQRRDRAPVRDVRQQTVQQMPSTAGMAGYILALQRTIGNQAVGRLLTAYHYKRGTDRFGTYAGTVVQRVLIDGVDTKDIPEDEKLKEHLEKQKAFMLEMDLGDAELDDLEDLQARIGHIKGLKQAVVSAVDKAIASRKARIELLRRFKEGDEVQAQSQEAPELIFMGKFVSGDAKTGRCTIAVETVNGKQPKSAEEDFNIDEIRLASESRAQTIVKHAEYHITHFHDEGTKPRASEYIAPETGKIDITNHGLGSGIYGLPGKQESLVKEKANEGTTGTTFQMKNPLHLQDAMHDHSFTSLSKNLQRLATKLSGASSREEFGRGLQESDKEVSVLKEYLHNVFDRVGVQVKDPDEVIRRAISDFMDQYKSGAKKFVEQPINFLMKLLGYDGIYADYNQGQFSRGSVLYHVDDASVEKELNEERIKRF